MSYDNLKFGNYVIIIHDSLKVIVQNQSSNIKTLKDDQQTPGWDSNPRERPTIGKRGATNGNRMGKKYLENVQRIQKQSYNLKGYNLKRRHILHLPDKTSQPGSDGSYDVCEKCFKKL